MDFAALDIADAGHLAGPCGFRQIGDSVLVVSTLGEWTFLARDEARAFLDGTLAPSSPAFARLAEANCLRDRIDVGEAERGVRGRLGFLQRGPARHTLYLTGDDGPDGELHAMTLEIARAALDLAFMSTSPEYAFELRGARLFENWDVLPQLVEYFGEKNLLVSKPLEIAVRSDLAGATSEQLAFLRDHDIVLRLVMDDAGLVDPESAARALVAEVAAAGAPSDEAAASGALRVELVVPVTRQTLGLAGEIVGTCEALGAESVDLDAGTFLTGAGRRDAQALAAFHVDVLRRLLDGPGDPAPCERTAALLVMAIEGACHGTDPALRSPAADGIGQLACGWDGAVYTSPEGLEIGAQGDTIFQLGDVSTLGYHDAMLHPTVLSAIVGTTLLGLPGVSDHPYVPFVGLSPARNYVEHGSLQGRPGESATLAHQEAVLDFLFARILEGGDEARRALSAWARVDERAADREVQR